MCSTCCFTRIPAVMTKCLNICFVTEHCAPYISKKGVPTYRTSAEAPPFSQRMSSLIERLGKLAFYAQLYSKNQPCSLTRVHPHTNTHWQDKQLHVNIRCWSAPESFWAAASPACRKRCWNLDPYSPQNPFYISPEGEKQRREFKASPTPNIPAI